MTKQHRDTVADNNLTLRDRIEGCLMGAVIGAELGWTWFVHTERYRQVTCAEDLLNLKLEPVSPAVAKKYDDVFAARKELYAKCLMFNWWQSAHLEIVGLPLAMFKIANGDVRQAAIGGTNIGRDADTNAGRAAMLAGAFRGVGHVPKEWIRMFKPAVLRRIKGHAKTMAHLISHQKLDRLRRRQVLAS